MRLHVLVSLCFYTGDVSFSKCVCFFFMRACAKEKSAILPFRWVFVKMLCVHKKPYMILSVSPQVTVHTARSPCHSSRSHECT